MTWRSKPIESEDEDDLNVEHMNRRMQQPAVAQPDERADSCEVCFIQTQDPRLTLSCAVTKASVCRSSCADEVVH